MKVHAVILAAGQGTRMKSALPKVLHRVGGTPMLGHVLAAARAAEVGACHVVLGHGAEQVREWLGGMGEGIDTVVQAQQLGTAHAVQQALPQVPDSAVVLVLYGDVPLVSAETLRKLVAAAKDGMAVLTAEVPDPAGYGRMVRDAKGRISGIVEDKDATPQQRAITEINTGLMAAQARRLKRWLSHVKNNNAKGEFYLTDAVALAVKDGIEVQSVAAAGIDEVEGVNDRVQLAQVERRYQRAQVQRLQRDGLHLADPARFDLRGSLSFGRDVFIDVGCVLEGKVALGDNVSIGPYCVLRDVKLDAGTRVDAHSVLDSAEAGRDCRIGPFARLRPGAQLADQVHIGNFVEIKKSTLGEGTKANHLAYIGDATVGARVNIGAGVITCNYDGVNKHATIIGDDAFIGTDSQLVAPLIVGRGAYIAAGSTIAKDAPEDALTVCRAREQKSFPGWKKPAKKR
ncbi:bifunctional UDP-N-acetylglucosamine diphosphorylase/glucosamine-1-phosphate N-acetyltransferase GlmU [Nevskia soli]|uniref:bifunctional UDP-N-acetylglucosamine diphosphorylase/glucosamine-1-phosphate N-acetyltransferase GlmU n=1 Tax=Nevskia soli TaxID=418856 RepID=UPI0004A6C645|nr:bifunctional UDP-N-acetylglucosamine diphosphorylase/glucosamine-1-phosphate N-acetyltransferase GlmU [Nevskia soli]